MEREPTKQQIKLWNRLVKEVFEHPKSNYSIFVMEMIKRRVLGTSKEEFRGSIKYHKKLGIKCLMFNPMTNSKSKRNLERIEPIETEVIPVEIDFKRDDGSIITIKARKIIRKRIASKKALDNYFRTGSEQRATAKAIRKKTYRTVKRSTGGSVRKRTKRNSNFNLQVKDE